ncbi:hypothetical protein HOH45_02600 [bacterium]|jgi:hypothetical protein|nr:hypothetical protein [bacterium]
MAEVSTMAINKRRTGKLIGWIFLFCLLVLLFWPPDIIRVTFSPSLWGFQSKQIGKVTVYYKHKKDIRFLLDISQSIKNSEKAHHLNIQKPIKIFIFNSHKQFQKFSKLNKPTMGTGLIGRRIWVAPKARDLSSTAFKAYISHELSHVLLYQNMSIFRGLLYPSWLIEGVATYYGQLGLGGYPNQKEVMELIGQGYFVDPNSYRAYFWRKKESRLTWPKEAPHKFAYAQFATVIQAMINLKGEDSFQDFLDKSLTQYDVEELFESTYGLTFLEFLSQFKKGQLSTKDDTAAININQD